MRKVTLTGRPQGKVLAVMVVWNGLSYLQAAIDSVLDELGPDNGLLVVDNDSTDGSYEYILEHYPQVAVLQTHENLGGAGGFSAGMQVALETADCQYVWLLDNDIVAEENSLTPLVQCLETRANAAAAGSQLCLYREPDRIQALGASYTDWLGDIQGNCYRELRKAGGETIETDYLAACSVLLRKDVIQEIGKFADLFIFFDDVEWCLRARSAGYSLWVVPDSIVRHDFGGEKPLVPWREYYRKRNKLYCLSQHPPRKLGLVALFIYLVFLNLKIFYNRWAGSKLLSKTYDLALRDFLQRNYGKQDLSSIDLPVEVGNPSSSLLYWSYSKVILVVSLCLSSLKAIWDFVLFKPWNRTEPVPFLEFQVEHAQPNLV